MNPITEYLNKREEEFIKKFSDRIDNGFFKGLVTIDRVIAFNRETHQELIRLIRELAEESEKNFNIEAYDNSGNRYQIPKSKKEEWNKWREIAENDEDSWEKPYFAERIDGQDVTNKKFSEVLQSIENNINNKNLYE